MWDVFFSASPEYGSVESYKIAWSRPRQDGFLSQVEDLKTYHNYIIATAKMRLLNWQDEAYHTKDDDGNFVPIVCHATSQLPLVNYMYRKNMNNVYDVCAGSLYLHGRSNFF